MQRRHGRQIPAPQNIVVPTPNSPGGQSLGNVFAARHICYSVHASFVRRLEWLGDMPFAGVPGARYTGYTFFRTTRFAGTAVRAASVVEAGSTGRVAR